MNSQTHSSMLLSQSQLVQWHSAPATGLHTVLLEVDKFCQEVSIEHGKKILCAQNGSWVNSGSLKDHVFD